MEVDVGAPRDERPRPNASAEPEAGGRSGDGAGDSPGRARAHMRGPAARYRAFRRRMRGNPVLDLTWRATVLTAGTLVVLAGVALLALPGPGWATIFIGLMILASEFAWARGSLNWVKGKAHDAHTRAMAPEVRRRNRAAAVAAAVVLVVAVVLYWQRHGFPGPVGDWLVSVWQA